MAPTFLVGVARERSGASVAGLPIWLIRAEDATEPGAQRRLTDVDGASASRTTSERSGRFSFYNVLPGAWWIGLAPAGDPPDHAFSALAVAIVIEPEDVRREIVLPLEEER